MKKVISGIVMFSVTALSTIEIKITSLSNTKNNVAMEVCGEAIHSEGKWPLVITVKHDQSVYTTLTSKDHQWCTLIKRWTFDGKVNAQATTLDGSENSLMITNKN